MIDQYLVVTKTKFKQFIQCVLDDNPEFVSYEGVRSSFVQGGYPNNLIDYSNQPQTYKRPTLQSYDSIIAYADKGNYYIDKDWVCYFAKDGIAFVHTKPCNFKL